MFRQVSSDLYFKSIHEIVKEYLKISDSVETETYVQFEKEKKCFISQNEIFSDNEEESKKEDATSNISFPLFFLQTQEYEMDEGEFEIQTRDRARRNY